MKTILMTIAEWLGEDRDCKFTASYTDKCMVLTRVKKTKKVNKKYETNNK